MNILITRPLIDVEDNMGRLFSLGHKIIHMPTLKISPKNEKPINVEKYDAFIFTSANAVRNLNILKQSHNNKINLFIIFKPILHSLLKYNYFFKKYNAKFLIHDYNSCNICIFFRYINKPNWTTSNGRFFDCWICI